MAGFIRLGTLCATETIRGATARAVLKGRQSWLIYSRGRYYFWRPASFASAFTESRLLMLRL
jgi:hypothetical protein